MLPFPSRILQRDRGTLQHSCVLDSQRNKYRKKIGGTERDTSICIVRELPVASGGLVEMKFGRCYVAPPSHKSKVLHTFVVREEQNWSKIPRRVRSDATPNSCVSLFNLIYRALNKVNSRMHTINKFQEGNTSPLLGQTPFPIGGSFASL